MTTLATLVVSLVGDVGGFVDSMKDAEREAERHGGGIKSALGGALHGIGTVAVAAGAAAGSAIISVGTAALASAMKLDEAYDTIRTGTGATGETLDQLKADFQKVFTSIPTDVEPAAAVISELNRRLGISGDFLTNLAEPLLEATRLMGGDAATNAGLFARVIGDWGMPLEDASTTLDELFVVSQKTGIGLDRLMSTVVQFGAPLRLMGFGFEESAALLGKWEKEGVNTELVLGSLRIAAGKFAKANVPLREGLLDTIDAITNAKTKSEALSIAMKVFGSRAGPDMAAAILEGRFAIDDLVSSLSEADGAIMQTSKETADFPEKFQVMKNKIEVALAPLGMIIMDGIGRAMDEIGPFLEQAIPAIIETFQSVTTWLDTNIWPAFNQIVTVLQTVIAWVRENWPQISGQITGAFESARAALEPIITAIQTIITTVFGVISQFMQEHGEEIKSFIQNAWNTISGIVSGVVEIVRTVVESVLGGIAAFVQQNQEGIKALIEGVWNAIKTIVETVLGAIKGIVNAVLAVLRGDWQTAWNAIKQVIVTVWEGIKSFIKSALDIIKSVLSLAWNAIKGEVNRVWTAIRTAIEKAFNQVVEFLKSIPERLATIGHDIIMGIVRGIESGAEAVWNALKGVIEDAIDSILRFLGLRSPSKLFADIGENMMAGLAMGIMQNARMPQLALNAALGNVALSTAGGGPRGDTITSQIINFNTTAPLDATRDAATIRALAGAL